MTVREIRKSKRKKKAKLEPVADEKEPKKEKKTPKVPKKLKEVPAPLPDSADEPMEGDAGQVVR